MIMSTESQAKPRIVREAREDEKRLPTPEAEAPRRAVTNMPTPSTRRLPNMNLRETEDSHSSSEAKQPKPTHTCTHTYLHVHTHTYLHVLANRQTRRT